MRAHMMINPMNSVEFDYLEEYEQCLETQKEAFLTDLIFSLVDMSASEQFKQYLAHKKSTPHLNQRHQLCSMISSMIRVPKFRKSELNNTRLVECLSVFIAEYFLQCFFDHFSIQDIAIEGLSFIFQMLPPANFSKYSRSYYSMLVENNWLHGFSSKLRFNTLSFDIKIHLCHVVTSLLDATFSSELVDHNVEQFLSDLPLVLSNICEEETHPSILWFLLGIINKYKVALEHYYKENYLASLNHLAGRLNSLYTNLNGYFPLSSYVLPPSRYYVGYEQLSQKLMQVLVLFPSINTGGCIDLVMESVNSNYGAQRECCLRLLMALLDSVSGSPDCAFNQNTLQVVTQSAPAVFHHLIGPFLSTNSSHHQLISTSFQLVPLTNVSIYTKNEISLRCYLVIRFFQYYNGNVDSWIPAQQQIEFYNSLISCMFSYNNWHTTRMINTLLNVVHIWMPNEFNRYVYAQLGFFIRECEQKCKRIRNELTTESNHIPGDDVVDLCGDIFSRKFLTQLCTVLKTFKSEVTSPSLNESSFVQTAVEYSVKIVDYCLSRQTEQSHLEIIDNVTRLVVYFCVSYNINITSIINYNINFKCYFLQHILKISNIDGDVKTLPPIDLACYLLLIKKHCTKPVLSFGDKLHIVDIEKGELSTYDVYRIYLMKGTQVIELLANTMGVFDVFKKLSSFSTIFNNVYSHCNLRCRAYIDQFVYNALLKSLINIDLYFENDFPQPNPILANYLTVLPVIFSRSWFILYKTVTVELKYTLIQQLLSIAIKSTEISLAEILYQFIFALFIYDATKASNNRLLTSRCRMLVKKCVLLTDLKPFRGYLTCVKLYHSFIGGENEDVSFDSNFESDFSNLQSVLSSKWIHWLKQPLCNNIAIFELFIQWLSSHVIESFENNRFGDNISLEAPIVLQCLSNLPDYSKIYPNLIEKYVFSSNKNTLSGSMLMENIDIFTNICRSNHTIIVSSHETIAKAIDTNISQCKYSLVLKIKLINFFVVLLEMFFANKLTPHPQLTKTIDFTLCMFIKDTKRVVRRAAAMCKNLLDTLPSIN